MKPTAECELSTDGTQLVVARCPLCGKTHVHGAGKPGTPGYPVLGHRVAHCTKGGTGYVLRLGEARDPPRGYNGNGI